MKCFVIMQFAPEFADILEMIESAARKADCNPPLACKRLDDSAHAGRIIPRLERALRETDLCIADISGERHNVMWEIGYAMALEKPTILIARVGTSIPFDVQDAQTIEYDPLRLSETLVRPLIKSIRETVAKIHESGGPASVSMERAEHSSAKMVAALREMIPEIIAEYKKDSTSNSTQVSASPDFQHLEGTWLNLNTGSHAYARTVAGALVVPYCFGGNHEISGAYFDWKAMGTYVYARYAWCRQSTTGFSLLKIESPDSMSGAWWYDNEAIVDLSDPNFESGYASDWKRLRNHGTPDWAEEFFTTVKAHGVEHALALRA